VRVDLGNLVLHLGTLVGDDAKSHPGRVLTARRADPLLQRCFARADHRATCVLHDKHPVHVQQVDAEHECDEHLVGDPAAGITQDLGVPGRPIIRSGSIRESMHVTIATPARATPSKPCSANVLA